MNRFNNNRMFSSLNALLLEASQRNQQNGVPSRGAQRRVHDAARLVREQQLEAQEAQTARRPPPPPTTPTVSGDGHTMAFLSREALDSALPGRGSDFIDPDPASELGRFINNLMVEAKVERLECAVDLLEAIHLALATDQEEGNAPPGTMTVNGWLGLIKRWEAIIGRSRKRHVFYSLSFFQDLLQHPRVADSPMEDLFLELTEMMEQELQVQ